MRASGPEYEIGRQLLTDEVNAAIDGAVEAGGSHVLVNDAHRTMYNLRPGEVHHHASYLSGRHKPLYMMEGLDATFDAAFMVAYHGAIGAEHAILSHTYNRSLPAAASRPVKTTFSPGRSILIGVSADSRSFGPCRSNSSPTDRPARFAAARNLSRPPAQLIGRAVRGENPAPASPSGRRGPRLPLLGRWAGGLPGARGCAD